MSIDQSTFHKQQERASQRRYIAMKRRQKKIRRIKRRLRRLCVIACLVVFCVAGRQVVKRQDSFHIDLKHLEQTANEPEHSSKKQPVKTRRYAKEEVNSALEVMAHASSKYQKIYENKENYPEDLLLALCNNDEMLDFVLGYPDGSSDKAIKLSKKELKASVPLFLQWDKRWGYASYGNSCIGISGCAPTCISMVAVGLTGNVNATPREVAQYASDKGYYLDGTGTQWSFLSEGGEQFGIHGRELGLDKKQIEGHLKEGHPIICSMGPGDFTTQGHFIVLTGLEDGKITVNDPNSRQRSCILWDYDTLAKQMKNLWVYTA
ncbi:C39 family peptidase [[Clostridium] polysaccharolyticum]|uniref:Peptidase_C39 like family protein n=1 Tax=[Clostridium] polysaccharolyticum TaxID=29364 RepID=A0A1I0CLB2_9FIRM|nr:C39 family peptidase [[Clostridium] polysaccharolyticum]SET19986.1 Peptidase_C39 like family protein [[Clostridium] polysaccharolyticum]